VNVTEDSKEQERIVKILDAAFEEIDRLKKNAEKGLQAVKDLWQATLREELKPKEGWKATTMDGVCSITSSLVDPRLPEYKNKLHVGGSNIESYTGKLSNLLTAEQEDLVSNKFYFDQTMVLYNKIRPYLVKIAMPDFDGICSADMYPLKPKNGVITREYLYYVLNSKEFTDYAILGSARAGMPKVNRDWLFAYSFSIPNIEKQKQIVSKLVQTESICNVLQIRINQEIAEYEALKQSVLRKAFSGEL
ncbi:MAG: restriction endonuclease subunit S, partial [Paludibacteraceae bacterium]|nr:restriction endonuclease subunit S [Paludibacteraceae bacterium]